MNKSLHQLEKTWKCVENRLLTTIQNKTVKSIKKTEIAERDTQFNQSIEQIRIVFSDDTVLLLRTSVPDMDYETMFTMKLKKLRTVRE
jgi:sigma54-dependent transcription regulator